MIQMIFTLLLLCATVARGAPVQMPKNLAVSVGGSSYFNCSNNDSVSFNWAFSPNGDQGSNGFLMTEGNCNIVTGFSGNFRTEKPNSSVCNLIVFNANLQLGGYYACYSGLAVNQAILVVADTSSTITSNVTEVIEGCEDDVFFELTVKYNGSLAVVPTPPSSIALPPSYPSLKWTSKLDPNNTIPSSETVTNTTSSSHIIVTATIPSVPSYVCTLYFNPPTNLPPYCDSSAPIFTFNWETTETNTSYNILNQSSITVTSYIESGICEYKVLECRPYAYPPPLDVHWLDVIRNEVVSGTHITAESGGEYVCSVTNIIKGNNRTANVTYELNDDSAFTMDKCKGVSKVNITMSGTNPSEVHTAKTLNKINLLSSENATEFTLGNATEVILTCIVDGLPNPSYIWNEPCNTKPSSQQITAKASGSYECQANNTINDRVFSESITIHLNLPAAPPLKCECPPSYPVDDSTDVIILGVFLGLSLLLNFALIVWILLPVMRKKNSPTEATSRPMEHANISPENSKTVNQSPTTGPYEELHRDPKPPTAAVYQGLSKSSA